MTVTPEEFNQMLKLMLDQQDYIDALVARVEKLERDVVFLDRESRINEENITHLLKRGQASLGTTVKLPGQKPPKDEWEADYIRANSPPDGY